VSKNRELYQTRTEYPRHADAQRFATLMREIAAHNWSTVNFLSW
jgi:hypothetical protein